MIIDTKSPEGKALVALAKLGEWVIERRFGNVYFHDKATEKMRELGMLTLVRNARTVYDEHEEETDLAKLPEGL